MGWRRWPLRREKAPGLLPGPFAVCCVVRRLGSGRVVDLQIIQVLGDVVLLAEELGQHLGAVHHGLAVLAGQGGQIGRVHGVGAEHPGKAAQNGPHVSHGRQLVGLEVLADDLHRQSPGDGGGVLVVRKELALSGGAALVPPQVVHELGAGYRAVGQRNGLIVDLHVGVVGIVGVVSIVSAAGITANIAVVEVLKLPVSVLLGLVSVLLGVLGILLGFVGVLLGLVIVLLGLLGGILSLFQLGFQLGKVRVEVCTCGQAQLARLQIAAQLGLQSLLGLLNGLLGVIVSIQLLLGLSLPLSGRRLGLLGLVQRSFSRRQRNLERQQVGQLLGGPSGRFGGGALLLRFFFTGLLRVCGFLNFAVQDTDLPLQVEDFIAERLRAYPKIKASEV